MFEFSPPSINHIDDSHVISYLTSWKFIIDLLHFCLRFFHRTELTQHFKTKSTTLDNKYLLFSVIIVASLCTLSYDFYITHIPSTTRPAQPGEFTSDVGNNNEKTYFLRIWRNSCLVYKAMTIHILLAPATTPPIQENTLDWGLLAVDRALFTGGSNFLFSSPARAVYAYLIEIYV